MLLKKIRLENIRSYLNQEIHFPEGSILLAGNIGTGKSTILMAIDFALFGLTRGILSGNALLRNGKDSGSVELNFSVDDNEITVKRILKRTSHSITQDSGFIIINGEKQEKSAVELKQAILELLNYPQDLLNKSKGLIYRYTVYTPQEEMKQILLGDDEVRIHTLRKVFGIDKYKRIQENSKLFSARLREKRKEFMGRIADLEDKKKERTIRENEKSSILHSLNELKPFYDKALDYLTRKKKEIQLLEEKKELRNSYVNELNVKKSELKHKQENLERNAKEILTTKKELDSLRNEIKSFREEDFKLNIQEIETKIKAGEDSLRALVIKISELATKKNISYSTIKKIHDLDVCPTCTQEVTPEHKEKIISEENNNICLYENELHVLEMRKKKLEEILEKDKNGLVHYTALDRKQELLKLKKDNLRSKEHLFLRITNDNEVYTKEIDAANTKMQDIQFKIDSLPVEGYEELRKEYDLLQHKERELHIKKAGYENQLKNVNESLTKLNQEILHKEFTKKNLDYLNLLYEWINEFFISTMGVMEKKIMLKVHSDFDALFQRWFDMLVGNENLKIKLGEDFSPLIIQDGYDLDYINLSGGEKTSAALAYRLALNQVINNLMSHVKTKDLLILDEPTDGFSDEQLDRMKYVLDDLNIKQVIIVSHEDKIESFVDHVIRLHKDEHVTRIN